jgi:hypothetical protein
MKGKLMHFLEFKFPKLVQTKTVLVTRGMSECNRLDTPTGRNPLGSTLEGLPFQDKRGKCTVMIRHAHVHFGQSTASPDIAFDLHQAACYLTY